MTKKEAFEICEFIMRHYDMVDQVDWFDFQALVLNAVAADATRGGYAKSLVESFPGFFEVNE